MVYKKWVRCKYCCFFKKSIVLKFYKIGSIDFEQILSLNGTGPTLGLFLLFSFFSNTNFTEKIVGISGIRTRIVRVEGEHADHLSTTTARHVVMGRTTAVDLYQFRFYYASRSMWPDVGIKSSQVFPKTCPKRGHSMFLLKMWPFQNYSESLQIFGLLLFATKNFQKFSHTGHGQPKTLFKMFAVTFVIFSRDES